MDNSIIYLDNAATSFPKPEGVYEAVNKAMRESCGNPGRAGHRLSLAAGRLISEARMLCAKLFNAQSPDCIVFTYNTTAALNTAIKGLLSPGDHVITSSLEHNSVTRPLHHMQKYGIEVTKLPTSINDGLSADDVKASMQGNTRLVVCSHVSNVTGTVSDISAIGGLCRDSGISLLVDAAQSAGIRHIDVRGMDIDLLAFPGHKGLLGPQGTGGLYIRPGTGLETMIQGGTGSGSETLSQPERMPDKFESGTPGTPGLAGLAAGVRFVLEQTTHEIGRREAAHVKRIFDALGAIGGIEIFGPTPGCDRGGAVSVRMKSMSPAEAALMLDSAFGIAVRAGLHCAADAHSSIGTLESGGTVRLSPGFFNTDEDIDRCLEALSICARGN